MNVSSQALCQVCKCEPESCISCTRPEQCENCNSLGSCCCESSHIAWHTNQVTKGVTLEYISLGWMTIEVAASIVAGLIIAKSFALLAFGGDSVIELLSSFAVFGYLRNLSKGRITSEAEAERTEKIATLLLILLVPVIAGGAVYSYFLGIKPEASLLGIGVAAGAVVIMPVLWIQKLRTGRRSNLVPLTIDAVESATCFFMSIALLGGLVVNYFLHITWADYVTTAVILGFVVLEIRESLEEMKDKHVGEERSD
jgi:divalent metal cation (Fe/Co/Zn/Cd) transporter